MPHGWSICCHPAVILPTVPATGLSIGNRCRGTFGVYPRLGKFEIFTHGVRASLPHVQPARI
jgi:hypothetical protein